MRIYARALFLNIAFRRSDARQQSRSFARWNQSLTEIAQVHGCFSSQSFWKRGSLRNGSQNGLI